MNKTKSTIQNEKYRVPTMAVLVGMCCLLTYYFHWVLGTEVVFSHFFYIPTILAAVWWKRRGLVVPLFLALLLLVSHHPLRFGLDWSFANNLMRAAVLIFIGVMASILRERMEKAEVRLRQHTENLERMVEERTRNLKETKDYLDNLIRYTNAPIIVWNLVNEITIFNQAFEKLSGRTEAEMMGQPLDVLFPEDSRADCLHKIEIASKGEYWETVEIPILRRDGEIRIGLWNSANIYSEDGETLIATIAQGQDITERVRSEETLRALNTAAATVQRVARTPEAVFTAVMEQLHAMGLAGAVALLDETRERFTIRYTAITSQVLAQAEKLLGLEAVGYSLPVEQLSIGGQTLAGETIFVPDIAALMAPVVPAPVRPLMPSAMRLLEMPRGVVAPLSVEGEIIGFLGVSADHMTEADMPVVTAFANQMAAALENAHLFQAEQRGRQVAEALQETGRVVNSSLDLDNVLPLILEQLAQVIQYDSSAVLLFDHDRLEMRAGRGFPNVEAALRLSFAADEDNLTSAVMRARRPLVIGDVENDPRWQLDPEVTHIRGWIGVPLIVHDKVVGVLTVDSRQTEAYSQEDGQLVFAFADQAAVAIQNAQLYEQAQQEIAERVRAERELEERRVYLEGVLGATPNAIVTLDENHLIVYWNPGAEILFGYSPEEVTGKNIDPLITNPGTYKNATALTQTILGGKKVSPTETVRYRKDGSPVDVIVVGSPILVGDELIGVVAVYTDITARKRAQESLQRRNRELALLNRVIAAASTTLEPKAVLETTCRELALAFDLPQAAAALLNEERTASVVMAEYMAEGRPSALDVVIPLEGNFATQYVVEHKAPLFIADAQHDPRMAAIHEVMRQRGTVSMLILPLMARGQVVGTLGLDAVERREFSDEEIALATNAAAAAAQALENARLFKAESQARQISDTLSEIARDLNAAPDLSTALDLVLSRMERVIASDSGSILLLENGGMNVAAIWGFDEPERVLNTHLDLDTALLNREIIETRQPLIIASVTDDPRWIKSLEASGLTTDLVKIHSWMGVPLLVQDRVIGILTADKAEPDFYQPKDAELALAFASHAAVTIEKARLFNAAQRQALELSSLYESALSISQELETEALLENLYHHVEQTFDLDAFLVVLYDQGREDAWIAYANERGERMPSTEGIHISPQDESGLISWVLRERRPLLIEDTQSNPLPREARLKGKPTRAWLGVPLLVGDHLIGVISVQSFRPQVFHENHRRLLEQFASQSAITLENARLFSQANQRLKRMEALHTIDRVISSSVDINMTASMFLDQALTQLEVDAADVLLFDPILHDLECIGRKGFRTSALEHTHLRLGQGLAGRAALGREIVCIPDLQDAEDVFLTSPELAGEAFVSYYGIPLVAKGVLKGVLEIFHRTPLSADDEWLMFLNALAGQAAIAIDNASMFTDLQRSNLELGLAYNSTLEGWAKALELRDMETEGHSRRVTEMTMRLAKAMGVDKEQLAHLYRGALLHDIGKMGVPDSILNKPGPLDDEEWAIMRQHPLFAYEMLLPIAYLRPALDIPYSHHEKWDGSGYPQGLRGGEIPLAARIFAIVDAWDALNSDRPYRKAWPEEKALEYIREQSGKYFDPKVTEAFLDMLGDTIPGQG